MSVFSKVQDYINARYDKKLERGLLRLNDKIKYNPEYNKLSVKYMTSERRSKKLSEYLVWWMGDEFFIRDLYVNGAQELLTDSMADMMMFWKIAPTSWIKKHTGIPGIISNKKSRILWGNGFNIDVEVFKIDGITGKPNDKVNEAESNRIRDILVDTLIPETHLIDHLKKSTEDESWSGHTALKFNYDLSVTNYPIIETADARNISINKERGHTIAISFMEWYTNTKTNKKYRLDETYTTVRDKKELTYYSQWKLGKDSVPVSVGDAVIMYTLYELKGGQEILIPMKNWGVCPELTGHLIDSKGQPYECVAFNGLQGMLALEKPNRLPNNDFPGSFYGASDYSRSILSFDALDELYSEIAREVRDNKALQYAPVSWFDKNDDGKVIGLNKFKTNFIRSESDIDQSQGNQPQAGAIEVTDRYASLVSKWKTLVGMICANAHISPVSLGGIAHGFESIAASTDSQREREKDTIDTRKEMLKLWEPYLNKMLLKMLEFNSWLIENGIFINQPGIEKGMDIDFSNCNVRVEFPDYVQSSDSELITTWGNAKNQGVADTETAVRKVYPQLPRDQQNEIINRIKLEQGMALDDPNALSLTDLTTPPQDGEGGEEE